MKILILKALCVFFNVLLIMAIFTALNKFGLPLPHQPEMRMLFIFSLISPIINLFVLYFIPHSILKNIFNRLFFKTKRSELLSKSLGNQLLPDEEFKYDQRRRTVAVICCILLLAANSYANYVYGFPLPQQHEMLALFILAFITPFSNLVTYLFIPCFGDDKYWLIILNNYMINYIKNKSDKTHLKVG